MELDNGLVRSSPPGQGGRVHGPSYHKILQRRVDGQEENAVKLFVRRSEIMEVRIIIMFAS